MFQGKPRFKTINGHPRLVLLETRAEKGTWYLVGGKNKLEKCTDGSFQFELELYYVPDSL